MSAGADATDRTDAPESDPVFSLVESLRDFDLALERYRADFAARCGINVHDGMIMSALLVPGERYRPSDVAQRLGITSGSLTAMLDRLEAAQMIVRERHPTDRRSVYIGLTELGATRLLEGRDRLREFAAASVPEESREPMTTGLKQFTAAITAFLG